MHLKTDKLVRKKKRYWVLWLAPVTGLAALVWFLVRVIPKPSRAAYPCQRAAFPLASGFVIWLLGLFGSVTALKKARSLLRQSRIKWAVVCMAIAIISGIAAILHTPQTNIFADEFTAEAHGPLGVAKGLNPGRVVWVHDPNATNWDGSDWEALGHTDLAAVENMVSQAIRGLSGAISDQAAWDMLFKDFNQTHGRGDVGYQSGEKIAIKVNMTNANIYYEGSDESCDKTSSNVNTIDNSPEMVLALLRQLVYVVGFAQSDISIGDTTTRMPNFFYDYLAAEFPDVIYFDHLGSCSGRTKAIFRPIPFYWSTPDAAGKVQDYIPRPFADAHYIINFAILKGHSSGITVCAKNNYGSLVRLPFGYIWGSTPDYYDMHLSLPNRQWVPGMGHYRALVDLMGHPQLGGKTMLNLIDGLFGGYYAIASNHPKWQSAPFNNDWPSSLFASQDAVAIDSVAYDFLLEEWPDVVNYGTGERLGPGLEGGAEDYLHEASQANNPPSGTFYDPAHSGNVIRLASLGVHEHWDNATDKQYSRNLGTGDGIELVKLSSINTDFNLDNKVDFSDLACFAGAWQSQPGDSNYNDVFDIAEPYDIIDERDLAEFAAAWLI